ncbi:MAG: metallochaperone AztD [Alphaproteobacteria bacterium]|nr:metallochaperone AztD [Alphaproteobacteria bacterium]MBU1562784.1 metallochaperone AztD [Alphaproteobacteria bacterium]MBU2303540.1 metallochaperone AztD [Alphaproteobacteria bacterium]MBU2367065.1 metallochaperone AztD [Alphaproteobacteria bacterium]
MHARFLLPLLAATALTLPTIAEDHVSAWRLFVADYAKAEVTAIDLASGDTLASIPLASPAALYTTDGAVFAVQGAGNQVSVIRSGIALDDHGDHGDIEISDPELVEAVMTGEKPAHFVEHGGKAAMFFDGSGLINLFSAEQWAHDGAIDAEQLDSGTAHHGVAIPWGDYTLTSVANADDEKKPRLGLNVLDADGGVLGETHACPDLHGEATSGNLVIVGCGDGLLIVSGSGEPQVTKLSYDGLPDGKATTFLGGVGMQYFLGNYGADRVVVIDPAEAEPYRLVDLPTRRVHFAVDPIRPKFAYIFTEDGKLNQLDVLSGEIVQSLAVTEPYSMDGDWSLPRPRIAVAGDVVAVTDPNQGQVHLIDIASFTETGAIPVAGAPYNIVAVGGSGAVH